MKFNRLKISLLAIILGLITSMAVAQPQANTGQAVEAESAIEKLRKAKEKFERNPNKLDNLIWYGRRMAYTGDYEQAIEIYSQGLEQFPNEARLYRHRGHRLISVRKFEAAIVDFEKAYALIKGHKDLVEQDGLPNAANIPVSTLHSNIRYHLALAYYLTNQLEKALAIYRADVAAEISDDHLTASTHWLYMTLRRLGRDEEAVQALSVISEDMTIYENQSYYDLCLLYLEKIDIEDLVDGNSETSANAARAYGVANWFSYNNDQERATEQLQKILQSDSKAAFGYIAAEVDLARQSKPQSSR